MQRENSGEQDSSNQYFLGNIPGMLYQQNPLIVYQSEGQNRSYNIFTNSQQYSNSSNFLTGF